MLFSSLYFVSMHVCVCTCERVCVCFFCIVMNMYLICPIYKILYCLCLAHYQTNIQRLNSLYLQARPPVSLKFWNLWTTESIQQRETTTISHQSSKTVQDKAIFNIVCLCGLTILRERLEETVLMFIFSHRNCNRFMPSSHDSSGRVCKQKYRQDIFRSL